MTWDTSEEHRLKERLAFNPRAMGRVGRRAAAEEDSDDSNDVFD
jgi:hypothetical protein